jgi:hypothetical protein
MEEFLQSANGVLGTTQLDIVQARAEGMTWRDIEVQFHLSGQNALSHCIRCTPEGNTWEPGSTCGTKPYLSSIDEAIFKHILETATIGLNCVTTIVARSLAHSLKERRYKIAVNLLKLWKNESLIETLTPVEPPSKPWLKSICTKIGFKLCNGQELEELRRKFCDKRPILAFFREFSCLFDRDKRLIFNMDETAIDARKKYKVLCTKRHLPITCQNIRLPHLTACITICAAGFALKPLVILNNKQKLQDLEDFNDEVFFSTSLTGWMTKTIFSYYCLLFISQIMIHRMTLPEHLRQERILLIVDGHKSRNNYPAGKILNDFAVDLLVLPGHCSHVLQPFDVSIAAPLKVEFKKIFSESRFPSSAELLLKAPFEAKKFTTSKLRHTMIDSFLTAHTKACTRTNSKAGFLRCGIVPKNSSAPLASHIVALVAIEDRLSGVRIIGNVHAMRISSEECVEMLRAKYCRQGQRTSDGLTEVTVLTMTISGDKKKGKALSRMPDNFFDNHDGTYRRFSFYNGDAN